MVQAKMERDATRVMLSRFRVGVGSDPDPSPRFSAASSASLKRSFGK